MFLLGTSQLPLMTTLCVEKLYQNAGSLPLLELLPKRGGRVLDCECDAGDSARILEVSWDSNRAFQADAASFEVST